MPARGRSPETRPNAMPVTFAVGELRASRLGEGDAAELAAMHRDPQNEIEVAYALRPACWGQGLAVAVTIGLIEAASACELCESVVAFTLSEHRRSRRVMEKAGFAYERDFVTDDRPHALYRRSLAAA